MKLELPAQVKFLFLDTNLLVAIQDLSKTNSFELFFNILKINNLTPVIDAVVEFEFLRSSNVNTELKKRKQFISLLADSTIPIDSSIYAQAIEIGNVYSNKSGKYNKQISLADCLIAAALQRYSYNSILATLDLKDFPLEVFDRVGVLAIDGGDNVYTMGFYRFNENKFKDAKRCFEIN